MPEERFHAQFGEDFTAELIKTPDGKATLQAAIDEYFPYLPSFFGGSKSKNNEIFRKWNIKQRTNDEMRAGLHEARDRGRHQVRPHPAGGEAGGMSEPRRGHASRRALGAPQHEEDSERNLITIAQAQALVSKDGPHQGSRHTSRRAAGASQRRDPSRRLVRRPGRAADRRRSQRRQCLCHGARARPAARRPGPRLAGGRARLKAPDWSPAWWDREEALRQRLLAEAEARYPERVLWTALTELTTEAGEIVHGKAATAASRMGGAAKASIHVAAGAAAQAAYQLALARLAEDAASPFESKFRLFAAGRWPLGVVGSTLVLF